MRLARAGVCARVGVGVGGCQTVGGSVHCVLERSLRVGGQGDWNVATTHDLWSLGQLRLRAHQRRQIPRGREGVPLIVVESATSTRRRANPTPTAPTDK